MTRIASDRMSDDEREQAGSGPAGGSAKDDDWDLIVPVPDTVPAPDMHHWILGDPAAAWTYRDTNGGRICFIGRYNKADGEKEFRPRTWWKNRETGEESGAGRTFPIRARSMGSNCSPSGQTPR